ncbi:hypothetical protein [Burkholderia sp. TSV86]|uniref:hypothetical protein n=1 Tax=Burkholderia sp. TSV86 TaxID=1385594 RepID=UPI000AC8407B|nr:hypothetical protein [Burkholderia sp. TSV86]
MSTVIEISPKITKIEVGKFQQVTRERWSRANQHVLWGWKRDVGDCSRVVYFSGNLGSKDEKIILDRGFFFLKSIMPFSDFEFLRSDFEKACDASQFHFKDVQLNISRAGRGFVAVTLRFGTPTTDDYDRVTRLQRRRRRKKITQGDFPQSISKISSIVDVLPADIYVGSGMSYECNLPTLCHMHNRFSLDDYENNTFTVGKYDNLPKWLATDFRGTVSRFCDVHTGALSAPISNSYLIIKELYKAGLIGKIFTDNVDNMFSLLDIPYERVRGSGVFNERYEAKFSFDKLLVIGVAADRREIIKQFRAKRKPIVVVNPCEAVSPGVQHLNYVRNSDAFYKITAFDFFNQIRGKI